ncbi:MAG: hypothetical protein IRZ28_22875, partial [Steroidobacteraceae bacterium]|nr:hypothetical protein [Steroidobacteraceae bacterium]
AYVRARTGASPPSPRIIAESLAGSEEETLSNIVWLSNSEVGYIGKASDGTLQAFAVDAVTAEKRQLTTSKTDVLAFSRGADTVLYYACAGQSRADVPDAVRVETFDQARRPVPDTSRCLPITTPMELFIQRGPHKETRKIPLPLQRLTPQLRTLWISPSAKYAITLAPAINAPATWAAYQVPDRDRWGFTPQWARDDATSFDLVNRNRWMLIDLVRGEVRPLLDAPAGINSFNLTPPQVFWPDEEGSVVVSNTFLPLSNALMDGRRQVEANPAVAEVDLQSGRAVRVLWEPVVHSMSEVGKTPTRIIGFDWSAAESELTVAVRHESDGRVELERYRKTQRGWEKRPTISGGRAPTTVRIRSYETLNERPRLFASVGGREKLLLDPNPEADGMMFGAARVHHWRDRNGVEWQGGLLLPVHYTPGKRYPLVVQTHGFDPDRFLLDGPSYEGEGNTAFAAQALANAGFVVLQVEDSRKTHFGSSEEGARVAEGFRAGIQSLIQEGIADPAHVGLIAFSRTGYHLVNLMARWPDLLAAASISDALQGGYMQYLLTAESPLGSPEITDITGGEPLGPFQAEWMARNPLYKIANSRTAVRLEAMESGIGMWETYVLLRKAANPVELVVYPNGSHLLQKPRERMISESGTVDWFRFWLQGVEDPNPSKADQYARWRKARDTRH